MKTAFKNLLDRPEFLHKLNNKHLVLFDSAKPKNDKCGKQRYCGLLYYVCIHCGFARKKQKDILNHLEDKHHSMLVEVET